MATQPLQVLTWQSRMISPSINLTKMLFQWSLEIFFPFESLHVGENSMDPLSSMNLSNVDAKLPFFVADLFPVLP